jgi:hypothetical protein
LRLQSWRCRCPLGPALAKGPSKTPSSCWWTALHTPPPSCRTSLPCSDPFLRLRTLWPRARHERWDGSARPGDCSSKAPPSEARSRRRPLPKRCPSRPLPAHKRAAAATHHNSRPTPAPFDIRRRFLCPVRSVLATGTVSCSVGTHAREAHTPVWLECLAFAATAMRASPARAIEAEGTPIRMRACIRNARRALSLAFVLLVALRGLVESCCALHAAVAFYVLQWCVFQCCRLQLAGILQCCMLCNACSARCMMSVA